MTAAINYCIPLTSDKCLTSDQKTEIQMVAEVAQEAKLGLRHFGMPKHGRWNRHNTASHPASFFLTKP
eukprot:jgi/Botrbrau1/13279/Bobra.27_2s0002.1